MYTSVQRQQQQQQRSLFAQLSTLRHKATITHILLSRIVCALRGIRN